MHSFFELIYSKLPREEGVIECSGGYLGSGTFDVQSYNSICGTLIISFP